MKLDLEVIASTNIRRKKPWPEIVWLGQEKESLFVLDKQRLSVLYVPSGKTKRRIPKLTPLLPDVVLLSHTRNGHFLIGLLKSGDIFLWHKDSDQLRLVSGPKAERVLDTAIALFANDDGSSLLLVCSGHLLYVWQSDVQQDMDEPGTWSCVDLKEFNPNGPPDNPATATDAVFFSNQVLSCCWLYSVVSTHNGCISICSLLLRLSTQAKGDSSASVTVEWHSTEFPARRILPGFQSLTEKGVYVPHYSHDGQILAVAANQNNPHFSRLLYVSSLTSTISSSPLRGCGISKASDQTGCAFWLTALAWTTDDLFLAGILRNGSVCLFSRLGEPLALQTTGCSVEMGPAYYLPLHPAIIIRDSHGNQSVPDSDPLGQRFSVAAHPRLPIILFSDGFLVTVIQLPLDMLPLMRDFVLESSRHLKAIKQPESLQLSLVDAYNLPMSKHNVKENKFSTESSKKKVTFQFEEPDKDLSATNESVLSLTGDMSKQSQMFSNMNSGKITFGQQEILLSTSDGSFQNLQPSVALHKHFDSAERYLMAAWKLAASCSVGWTDDLEMLTKQVIHNIINLFSVCLDCSGLEEKLLLPGLGPNVDNIRVFKIMSVYKSMLHLLHFDSFSQHLLPIALRLAHRTLTILLNSKGVNRADPRIKTLNGCQALLTVTEIKLNKVYSWQLKGPTGARSPQQDVYEPASSRKIKHSAATSQPSKRLGSLWKVLYRSSVQHQASVQQNPNSQRSDQQLADRLVFAVQHKLQQLGSEIPQQKARKVNSGDKLSVDGMHTLAMEAWGSQLRALIDEHPKSMKTCKRLHSLLYTYITKGELSSVLMFVDNLIIESIVAKKHDLSLTEPQPSIMPIVTSTLKEDDEQPQYPRIRNKAIRELVQTLARFMAAYFSNSSLYVYPPHNAQSLPPVYKGIQSTERVVPVYHDEIARIVRQQELDSVWTADKAVEYLLLCGLVAEAAWFADRVADWKASFLLSVACVRHKSIVPHLYHKCKTKILLQDSVTPRRILERKLKVLFLEDTDFLPIDDETNLPQLTRTLHDVLTAAVVCEEDVLPWLLHGLVDHLKQAMSGLHPIVPSDIYLPAPPLYCPQPHISDMKLSAEGDRERRLRYQVSSHVQLILIILKASNLALPLSRWYVRELASVQERAAQFKSTTEGPALDLPDVIKDYLSKRSQLHSHRHDESVHTIMTCYREFCSLLWLLHVRDNLSINLRQRQKYLAHLNYDDHLKKSWDTLKEDNWLQECFNTLKWAVNLLPFSRYLTDEGCVYKIVLSLLMELPPTEDSGDILAEHFHDQDNLDPEVQEKLEGHLKDWQGIILMPEGDGKSARLNEDTENLENGGRKSVTFLKASPRGKSLSIYFEKQCQVVLKVLKKKRKCFRSYEEFLFEPKETDAKKGNEAIHIGSRPFETKQSYIEFLDTYLAITFSKLLDSEHDLQGKNPLPLIGPFMKAIADEELQSASFAALNTAHHKHNLALFSSPPKRVLRSQSESTAAVETTKSSVTILGSPKLQKSKGLFRSVSSGDAVRKPYSSLLGRKYASEDGLDFIEQREAMAALGKNESQSKSNQNLTQLASRFSRSEEKLYREPSLDENVWSIDIDFGTKYNHLIKRLEWLNIWTSKHHSLEWSHLKSASLKPTIKVLIRPRFIVLSLWLLEHEYYPLPASRGKADNYGDITEIKQQTGSIHEDRVQTPTKFRSRRRTFDLHSSDEQAEELTDEEVEAEQVKSAYETLLQDDDDSSSLMISSLESVELDEDLRKSLSIIRGEQLYDSKSLNKSKDSTASKKSMSQHLRHSSKAPQSTSARSRDENQKNTSVSPHSSAELRRDYRHLQPPTTSQSKLHVMKPSQSLPIPGGQQRPISTNAQLQMPTSTDLASQLQNIVRGEFRKIMEVQHKGLLAMLGAMNDTEPLAYSQPSQLTEQSGSTASQKTSPPYLKSPTGSENIRGVLSELKNLQHDSANAKTPARQDRRVAPSLSEPSFFASPGRSSSWEGQGLRMSSLQSRAEKSDQDYISYDGQKVPRFQRMTAEKDTDDFILPKISRQALGDNRDPYHPGGPIHMPLLKLGAFSTPSNVRLPSSSFIPPPFQPQQFSNSEKENFPAGYFTQNKQGGLGIPLLHIKDDVSSFSDPSKKFVFGQLVPAPLVMDYDRKVREKELLREQYLLDLQQRELEEQEADLRKNFGRNLLKIIPREPPRVIIPPKVEISPRPPLILQRDEKETTPRIPPPESQQETAPSRDQATSTAIDQPRVEDEELNHGYAIRPGAYDSYLHLDTELGGLADNNARTQYDVSKSLQRQKRRVEFGTMTKDVQDVAVETEAAIKGFRTAEAATSITTDTGTDAPVVSSRQEDHVIPPHIIMGLRYGDKGKETSTTDSGSRSALEGRAYLNVVDIDSEAVLRDIPDSKKVDKPAPRVTTSLEELSLSHNLVSLEETTRDALRPRDAGPDSLTIKLFTSRLAGENRVSVAVLPRERRARAKESVVRSLRAMNEQLEAIDHMTNRIESEFKDTRLLLHTVDSLGTAMSEDVDYESEQIQDTARDTGRQIEDAAGLSPIPSESSPRRNTQSIRGATPLSPRRQTGSRGIVGMSGMSGISDIIGELVAEGGVDLAEAGLTEREAEKLTQISKAKKLQSMDNVRLSVEKLQQIFSDTDNNVDYRDAGRRQELHKWMAAKQAHQREEYQRHKAELREQERQPYQPPVDTMDTGLLTYRELSAAEQARVDNRKTAAIDNWDKRVHSAEKLLGSLLTDRPALPEESERELPTSRRQQAFGKTKVIKTTTSQKPGFGQPYPSNRKRKPATSRQAWNARFWVNSSPRKDSPPEMIDNRVAESSRIVSQRARTERETEKGTEQQDEQRALTRTYQPFTDVVRMQRPEVTRANPSDRMVATANYVDRLAEMAPPSPPPATIAPDVDKERLYGSKRIPGITKPLDSVPRQLKTYTERLQDMKQFKEPYSAPAARKLQAAAQPHINTMATSGSAAKKPAHKPVTYAQQLKQLAGPHRTAGIRRHAPIRPQRGLRARPPAHRPQTYVEQLKATNTQAKNYTPATRRPAAPRKMVHHQVRPYSDPYQQDWESNSVLSSWSMDDDVWRILYADGRRPVRASRNTMAVSTDYAPSEDVSDYYDNVMRDSYTDLVNIDDLDEAVSMGTGSIMSFIDWDAVDQLIEDEQ